VIRHQTPRANLHAKAIQFVGHEIELRLSICVSLEDGNRSHASLRDLMRIPRRYNPGNKRMREP